jgi:hypothetical protein
MCPSVLGLSLQFIGIPADTGYMWMTLHDAARACGVSRRTLYNWRERGALRTRTTPGGRWLVWVDAELIESAGKSAPAPWKEREAALKDLRKRLVTLASQLHPSHLGASQLIGEAYAFDEPRLEGRPGLTDSLHRRNPDGGDPYGGAHGAPGRAVAQEWGVGGELRAASPYSDVDVLVLAAQAVGDTSTRAAAAGVRAGAGCRGRRSRDRARVQRR